MRNAVRNHPDQRRMAIWRHNSFLGFARMTELHMQTIIDSPTTTDEAKAIAETIRLQIPALIAALKTRKDI